jgi:threonine dehydrogenase-like Zn-dependent dehydrogenase
MISARMKALTWHGGPRLDYGDQPAPDASGGAVSFNVALAGVCGSDLHPYRGHHGPRTPPLVLGHEAIGTVAGDDARYVVFPIVSCGACAACLRGEENLCATRGLLGLDRQGVFAETVAVNAGTLTPIPPGVSDQAAVLTEPFACAVSALRYAGAAPGQRVLVLGGGPIGLLTVHACAVRGIEAIAVEPVDARRDLARRLGAAQVAASVDDLGPGEVDVAIDAVGIEPTWQAAVARVRAGGSVTVIGLGQAEGVVAVGDMVRRGITMRGHYAYTRADFDAALQTLGEHPPDLEWLTVLPLSEGAEAFRRLVEEPEGTVKALLAVSA